MLLRHQMTPEKFIAEKTIGPFTFDDDGIEKTILLSRETVKCARLVDLVEFRDQKPPGIRQRRWFDDDTEVKPAEIPGYMPIEDRLLEQIEFTGDTLSDSVGVIRELNSYYPNDPVPLAFSRYIENLADAGLIDEATIGRYTVAMIPLAKHIAEAVIYAPEKMMDLFRRGMIRTNNNLYIVGQQDYCDAVVVDGMAHQSFKRIHEALEAEVEEVLYEDEILAYVPKGFHGKVRIVKQHNRVFGKAHDLPFLTAIFGNQERAAAFSGADLILDPVPPGYGGVREYSLRFHHDGQLRIILDLAYLGGDVPAVFGLEPST